MKRWIPLLIILTFLLLFYLSGLNKYLSLDYIRFYYDKLTSLVAHYPVLSPICFTVLYCIAVTMFVPDMGLLSILAGLLFPQPWAMLSIVIGGTIGATCVYIAAKTAFHDWLLKKTGPLIEWMHADMQNNAALYLLFLRLVPVMPFWITNVAPALFNVPVWTYIWTTFIGIIPLTFVFTQAGAGVKSILERNGVLSLDVIFNDEVKLAFVGLGLLALIPLFARFLFKRQDAKKRTDVQD